MICLGAGAVLSQAQLRACGHQAWLPLTHVDSPISSLGKYGGGGEHTPRWPRPYYLSVARGDGMRAGQLVFSSKRRQLTAEVQKALPFLLCSPTPAQGHPINSNSLNLCGVNGWGLWLCWVNNLVRKIKELTEAWSTLVSLAQFS